MEINELRKIRKKYEWLFKELKKYNNKKTPSKLKIKAKSIFKEYREATALS